MVSVIIKSVEKARVKQKEETRIALNPQRNDLLPKACF